MQIRPDAGLAGRRVRTALESFWQPFAPRGRIGSRLARAWRCATAATPLGCLFLALLPAPALASAEAQPVYTMIRQAGAARAQGAVSIRVHPGNWGAADPRDIARVLSFVADLLAPAFPRHAGDVIDISYRPEGPVTLLERLPDGAYNVFLTVQDTRWDQFTYQFAHEYCHVVTNAEQRVHQDSAVRGTQWFEESLCEAVSLLALHRVAAHWTQAAPVATVPGYASAFSDYAEQLINQAHRRIPAGAAPEKPLEIWYSVNRIDLELDPYLRKRNEVVANALYAWLRDSAGALEAIGYIGVDGLRPANDGQALTVYLKRWLADTPERLRSTVMHVPALFGIAVPDTPSTRVVRVSSDPQSCGAAPLPSCFGYAPQ